MTDHMARTNMPLQQVEVEIDWKTINGDERLMRVPDVSDTPAIPPEPPPPTPVGSIDEVATPCLARDEEPYAVHRFHPMPHSANVHPPATGATHPVTDRAVQTKPMAQHHRCNLIMTCMLMTRATAHHHRCNTVTIKVVMNRQRMKTTRLTAHLHCCTIFRGMTTQVVTTQVVTSSL